MAVYDLWVGNTNQSMQIVHVIATVRERALQLPSDSLSSHQTFARSRQPPLPFAFGVFQVHVKKRLEFSGQVGLCPVMRRPALRLRTGQTMSQHQEEQRACYRWTEYTAATCRESHQPGEPLLHTASVKGSNCHAPLRTRRS